MTNQNAQQPSEEIDIGLLCQKVWSRKKAILAFIFAVVLVVIVSLFIKFLMNPPLKEYSRIFQLNFAGAANGQYPSGQRFSVNDLLAPKVLAEVYKINDLGQHNVVERVFLEAFSVSPYANNIEFIHQKFNTLLRNKKLSRPEIEGLEQEYLQQLTAARAKFVKIAYINSSLTTLSSALIDKVLLDIPKIWSRQAIKELGVLNLNIASGRFYDGNIGERFEYVKMLSYLKKGADDLIRSLTVLAKDEIGGLIVEPASGKGVQDLRQQVMTLQQFDIKPLYNTITNLGIVKSKFKAGLYLQNTIQELRDEKELLEKKLENYKSILDIYKKGISIGQSADTQNGSGGQNSGFTQMDGSFFDRMTTLIEDKSNAKYIQKLIGEQLDIMQSIEEHSARLVKLHRALKQLNDKENKLDALVNQEFIDAIGVANQQLIELNQQYRQLIEMRNKQVLGNSSALYGVADTAMKVQSGFSAFAKRVQLFSLLAAIFACFIGVVIALIVRPPNKTQHSS